MVGRIVVHTVYVIIIIMCYFIVSWYSLVSLIFTIKQNSDFGRDI